TQRPAGRFLFGDRGTKKPRRSGAVNHTQRGESIAGYENRWPAVTYGRDPDIQPRDPNSKLLGLSCGGRGYSSPPHVEIRDRTCRPPEGLTRDPDIERKLDRPDEFDLEALGLAEAVSRFNRSKGVQGCA